MTFIRGDLECEGVAMGSGMRKHRVLTSALVVQILAIFVIGSFVGVGLYTFIYAKGYILFRKRPKSVRELSRYGTAIQRVASGVPLSSSDM